VHVRTYNIIYAAFVEPLLLWNAYGNAIMRSVCIVVDLRVTVDNIKPFIIATETP